MEQFALTRASTIGPIVDFVEQGGGSIERLFSMAELPIRLCEKPDMLIPLHDQFKFVECAARELGDDALPARLAASAGIAGLGAYGRQFIAGASLGEAIRRGNDIYTSVLQSATCMTLTVQDRMARWTYRVTEPTWTGRQKNEILAIGYMLELLRRFVGANWVPTRTELPGATLRGRTAIETLFRCDISYGDIVSVTLPAELLETPNRVPRDTPDICPDLPITEDLLGHVQEVVRLGLLDGHPQRAWVARRLNLSVRTLQRRLKTSSTSFAAVARGVREQRAAELLRRRNVSVSEVAYELGYSDPAHFSRAFTHWRGEAPQHWRRRLPPSS